MPLTTFDDGASRGPDPDVIHLTRELVRLPSTYPTATEARCAEYVEEFLRQHGIASERVPVADGRWNVVARVPGGGGPPLVLLAHMDTVPVGDGWSRDPFGGTIEGGRMWGRGTCDMKGGLAAALAAVVRVRNHGARLSGDLILAATVDEESAMTGAVALVAAGWVPGHSYILAAEPSDGMLLSAQKGVVWYDLRFRGISAHASIPHLGADANRALARAIDSAYAGLAALGIDDPLLGGPTLVAGVVAGGLKTNVVSDAARVELDIRYPQSVTLETVRGVVESAAEAASRLAPGVVWTLEIGEMNRPPVVCAPDSPLIAAVREAHRSVLGGTLALSGFRAYTDAAVCAAQSGSPHCVVYGPGQLAQAHAVDEYVDVDDLLIFAHTLTATALTLLAS